METAVTIKFTQWIQGLEKKTTTLNSSLPFGQAAIKGCLPWASLSFWFLFSLTSNRQETCLGLYPSNK